MRFALLTDGVSEYKSLAHLLRQVAARSGHTYLPPVRFNSAPEASAVDIARVCKPLIKIAARQRADIAVVLLDRETRADCPGKFASEVEAAAGRLCSEVPVSVCLKDRMLENWLIADPVAIAKFRARYDLTDAIRRKVEPDKADRCDGLRVMKTLVRSPGQYEKVPDAEKILQEMDVLRAAANSRSLRHFLHVLGDTTYESACKVPVIAASATLVAQ